MVVLVYDQSRYEYVEGVFKDLLQESSDLTDFSEDSFFIPFINKFKKRSIGYDSYLDEKFGELRAPKRVNKEETANNNLASQEVISLYGKSDEYNCLSQLVGQFDSGDNIIWAISEDGAILIGEEINRQGHPTLTKFKPARIAGEIHPKDGKFYLNSKSGRYSSDYENSNKYLLNAAERFKEIFPSNEIEAKTYLPKPLSKISLLDEKVKSILNANLSSYIQLKQLYPLLRSRGVSAAHKEAMSMIKSWSMKKNNN